MPDGGGMEICPGFDISRNSRLEIREPARVEACRRGPGGPSHVPGGSSEIAKAGCIPAEACVDVQPIAGINGKRGEVFRAQRQERFAGLFEGDSQLEGRLSGPEAAFDRRPESWTAHARETSQEVVEAGAVPDHETADQALCGHPRHAGSRIDCDEFLSTHSRVSLASDGRHHAAPNNRCRLLQGPVGRRFGGG